jgi:hypothetical protein
MTKKSIRWITGLYLPILSAVLTACGGSSMPPAGAQFEAWHDAGMNPPDAPYGVWNMARKDGTQASFEEQAAALEAIGYLDGSTAAPANTGVRLHLKDKAQQGLNFYTSGHAPAAWLMDMEGKVLHEWWHELKDIWPDYPLRDDSPKTGYWRRAHLLPDGSVLAIFEGIGIIKVNKDSKLLWAQQNGAHHDLELQPNGDIWVLTRKAHAVPDIESRFPTLEDFATLMDKDGNEKQSISLLDAARKSGEIGKEMWSHMQPDGDVMHTNSIAVVRGGQPTPGFAEGNLILSMLFVNTVAVLDPAAGKFVWAQREPWKRQHHARILSTGKLMTYDNRSTPNHTALVEMDQSTRQVTWEYRGSEEQPFYSYSCGAYHEQPNGNFVIVESDGGRAFEITRDKKKVWEFYNPNQAGDEGQYIATLFDLVRIAPDYLSVPLGQ